MKNTLIILVVLLTACSNINATESNHNEENEYSILLSSILNINNVKYTYIDEKGKKQPDSLKKFKELERIYIKNIKPDLPNNKLSMKHLKIIMFYAFYAHEKKSGAFQEYLASDLMPIYIKNKNNFLKTLKQLPFLTSSSCNRLNAYFGFEGKNTGGKPNFIKLNNELFKNNMNANQYKICIKNFTENPNKSLK